MEPERKNDESNGRTCEVVDKINRRIAERRKKKANG